MRPETPSYYQTTQQVTLGDMPPLAGHRRVDVAVIGGGITGCSAALHLAERGYSVALLEARQIGWGASGRSGGQILTGFGTSMASMAEQLGITRARLAWDMSREAVALTRQLVADHAIPCDLAEGAVYAAIKPRHLRAYENEMRLMADSFDYHGFEWLDGDALYERVRSRHYIGGLREAEDAHLHPLNYVLGLARAARIAGATLHENSRVTRLERGAPARIETDNGSLEAAFVVLAANAYLDGNLAPELAGTLMPVGNYIAATEPLTEDQIAQTLPGNDAVSDANFVLDYYHLAADRRLLFGGQVSYGKRQPKAVTQRMAARLAYLFPVLDGIRMDYQWQGTVGVTASRAPHFGRLGNNVFFAQGYSGHGMALAGLAGKLMAEAIAGQAERFDLYTRLRHRRFPGGERMRTPLLVLATYFYRLRDWL